MSLTLPSLSPLQLKTHSFPVVSIRANPNGQATGACVAEQHVSCVPVPGSPNHWNLQLQLFLHSADPANPFFYESEIVAVGVVEIIGDVPTERREQIAAVNGLSLLYSACREMLLIITARSLFGPFSIPSLNFQKVLQEAQANLQGRPKQLEVALETVKS